MPGTRYQSLSFTRFFCGCIHRTVGDTAVFCPEHHRVKPQAAFITGTELLRFLDGTFPYGKNITSSPNLDQAHKALRNTSSNTLHVTTTISDPGRNEWAAPEAESVGICPACLIEDDLITETRITACECGDTACFYRWCGRTHGIHAFWRFHATNRIEELTDTPDGDIFAYGPQADQSPKVKELLDTERQLLEDQASQLLTDFFNARANATPDAGRRQQYHPVYLSCWLDRDYEQVHSAYRQNHAAAIAGRLKTKLLRLMVGGAITPPLTPPKSAQHSPQNPRLF